jgi:DNA-binding CsgD family transcriptional regulator
MSLFRRLLEYLMGERDRPEPARVFLQDAELIAVIKDVAKQQSRAEEDVMAEFTKVGLNQFIAQTEMQNRWSSLSDREQQVVALVCLGSRNYEIAQTLGIAPETVKTHLQHIYDKLHLRSSKELRLALKDCDFRDWWERHQHE